SRGVADLEAVRQNRAAGGPAALDLDDEPGAGMDDERVAQRRAGRGGDVRAGSRISEVIDPRGRPLEAPEIRSREELYVRLRDQRDRDASCAGAGAGEHGRVVAD